MRTPQMGLIWVMPLVLGVVEPGVLICVNDGNCKDTYSCVDGTCTKCLMCSFLFRKGSSCVTDFRKCGDCLEGYEEISVTDFSTSIKPCKPMKRNVKFKECTSNSNCPPDNYCSEDSCIQCFDCSAVNRVPPVDNCAKGLTECGSCADGFSEAAVTAGTNYTRCEMEDFVKQNTVINFALSASFIVFLGLLFLLILLLIRISKSRSMQKIDSPFNTLPSAPPLQDMDVQQTVFKCPISPLLTPANSNVLFEREKRQQAVVFKQPDALYYTREHERGDDAPVQGSNSSAPCSNRAEQQQEPSRLSLATLTPRLDVPEEYDTTDSSAPATNEISIDANNSASRDSVTSEHSGGCEVTDPAQ